MLLIDETEADLTALVEADFGPQPQGIVTEKTVMAWLQYRGRLIAQRPRIVHVSAEVQALRSTYTAIGEIAACLRIGADVSPWLSNRIRTLKAKVTADLMFNDWQVSHFHLGPFRPIVRKVERDGSLLYVHVDAHSATLIDVQPHNQYTRTDLLRILLRTNPDAMPELVGILPSPNPFTDEQRKVLRSKHANTAITIDGRSYAAPGMGIVGAGIGLRFVVMNDQLKNMIREVVERVSNNTLEHRLMRTLAGQIGVPVRLGLRFEQGIFSVYDKHRLLDLMWLPRVVA